MGKTFEQSKLEPEVRKAGGVYYTPAYIVDYIVAHTIGRQIEDQSPAQLAGGKDHPPFRVLDTACGGGAFLLGAYQSLLDYCLKWYIEHNPERSKKVVCQDSRDGHWRLTIGEKKRILATHIFGVDIDAQAVDVTKLSLLLKVFEGETDQGVGQQPSEKLPSPSGRGRAPCTHGRGEGGLRRVAAKSGQTSPITLSCDRALPDLADNVKCGNSLLSPDDFTGKSNLDREEIQRINPFDWKQGFPDAMNAGGFDCVIGNPPYRRELDYKELMDEIVETAWGRQYRARAWTFGTISCTVDSNYSNPAACFPSSSTPIGLRAREQRS